MYGVLFEAQFQSFWINGFQFDVNSGNAFSLSVSPDGYQFTWALDLAAALPSPAVGMSFFQQNPGLIFPFSLGNCGAIVLFETCNLQTPPTQVSPVEVTDVQATSFTFTSLPGHFDPVGSTVTFSLFNSGAYQFLQQTAQWAPGGSQIKELASVPAAYLTWFDQAVNLAYWLKQLVIT